MRCLLALLLFLFLLGAVAGPTAAENRRVVVERATVHAARSKFSPVLATLSYGQPVDGQRESDWYRLTLPGPTTGYVHASALIEPAAIEAVGGGGQGATPRAMAAAVRGFKDRSEAEAGGVGEHGFAVVDRIETLNRSIGPAELEAFRRAGRLGEFRRPVR